MKSDRLTEISALFGSRDTGVITGATALQNIAYHIRLGRQVVLRIDLLTVSKPWSRRPSRDSPRAQSRTGLPIAQFAGDSRLGTPRCRMVLLDFTKDQAQGTVRAHSTGQQLRRPCRAAAGCGRTVQIRVGTHRVVAGEVGVDNFWFAQDDVLAETVAPSTRETQISAGDGVESAS